MFYFNKTIYSIYFVVIALSKSNAIFNYYFFFSSLLALNQEIIAALKPKCASKNKNNSIFHALLVYLIFHNP